MIICICEFNFKNNIFLLFFAHRHSQYLLSSCKSLHILKPYFDYVVYFLFFVFFFQTQTHKSMLLHPAPPFPTWFLLNSSVVSRCPSNGDKENERGAGYHQHRNEPPRCPFQGTTTVQLQPLHYLFNLQMTVSPNAILPSIKSGGS